MNRIIVSIITLWFVIYMVAEDIYELIERRKEHGNRGQQKDDKEI